MTEATECIVFLFLFITMTKAELPLSLALFLCDDEGTTALWVRYCVPFPHVRTHACITKWLMQPANPFGLREFSHDAAERHSVWLTSERGGQLEVWLADAMRPGMLLKVWFSEADLARTKKKKLISTSFCVVLRHWRLSHSGLDFTALCHELLVGHIATCLRYRSVPELLCHR